MAVKTLTGSSQGGSRQTTITGSSQGGSQPKKTTETTTTNKGGATGSTTASIDTSGLSGGLSGSGSSGGFDYASMIEAQLANQRAAAEAAYRNSMARLGSAWDDTTSALAKNLEATRSRLQRQYDYNSGVVNDDANKSLREAYVNYMMNKKNLNQGLSAMGLSGGATESNMAKMYNNYGNSRNNINTTLSENIAQLLNDYQNNLSQAEQLYNTQYADARNNYMQQMNALEAALANNLASTYSGGNLSSIASYASALNNLNNDLNYTPTTNTLAVNSVNTVQGNDMGSVTDYAKWKAMVDSMANQGASTSSIIYQLMQSGVPKSSIYNLLGA